MTLPEPEHLITKLANKLPQYLTEKGISQPHFVGIRTGGVWIAQALLKQLGRDEPLGILDVSFYRDDFTRKGLNPQVQPSQLPFDVDDQHLILIDDVLMTGRTIRAALNELFDYGRPASVSLVCLIDLNARELPIRPDLVGASLALGPGQRVKLRGPQLSLELQSRPSH